MVFKHCVVLAVLLAAVWAMPGGWSEGGRSGEEEEDYHDMSPMEVRQKLEKVEMFESLLRNRVKQEVWADKEKMKKTFHAFMKFVYIKHKLNEAKMMEKLLSGQEEGVHEAMQHFKDKMAGKKGGDPKCKLMMMWKIFLEFEYTAFLQFKVMEMKLDKKLTTALFFESFAKFVKNAMKIKGAFEEKCGGKGREMGGDMSMGMGMGGGRSGDRDMDMGMGGGRSGDRDMGMGGGRSGDRDMGMGGGRSGEEEDDERDMMGMRDGPVPKEIKMKMHVLEKMEDMFRSKAVAYLNKDPEETKSYFKKFVMYAYAKHKLEKAREMERALKGHDDVMEMAFKHFKGKMQGRRGGSSEEEDDDEDMKNMDEKKAKLLMAWKVFAEMENTIFTQGAVLEHREQLGDKAVEGLFLQSFSRFMENVMKMHKKAEMMKKAKEEGGDMKEKFMEFAKKMMSMKED